MTDYLDLIGDEDRWDPGEESYNIEDPPTAEAASQLWQSARDGPAAFRGFMKSAAGSPYDRYMLMYCIDQLGQNFLHMAAYVGDPKTIGVLNATFHDRHGKPSQRVIDLQEMLPRQSDVNGNRPLHIAAAADNVHFANALIEYHTFGTVTDQVDLENTVGEIPSLFPSGALPVSREEIRYRLPLLDFKNKAGRTAAQEAWFVGSTRTARWLDAYKRQYVGDEGGEEFEENVASSPATPVHVARCCCS